MMKRYFSFSLMGKVVLALAAVGILPLVIHYFQADKMGQALVNQSQMTQLATVRGVADQIAARLQLWSALVEASALSPSISNGPSSTEAGHALTNLLRSRSDILSAGLYLFEDGEAKVVQQASREGLDAGTLEHTLAPLDPRPWLVTSGPQGAWVRVRQAVPGWDGVVLLAVAHFTDLDTVLRPQEKLGRGDVELVLVEAPERVITGYLSSLEAFPASFRQQAASGELGAGADEIEGPGGNLVVSHADVPGVDWYLLSLQSEEVAKSAAGEVRGFAIKVFLWVLALASGLAVWAFLSIVQPIRSLVRAQRHLAGLASEPTAGTEIEQLQDAFLQLEQNMHDREAMSKVFLGRFQVIETLGVGAMGTVFRGFDPKLKRQVALKTFKLGEQIAVEEREELSQTLVREAVALARIHHPNIVTVFDIVEDGSAAFIAMELVEGVSLEAYLYQVKSLEPQQTVALGILVLEALAAAHENGIVHHDVKPANILLGEEHTVKVTDFGIAEVLSSTSKNHEVVCGTPGYLPPETLKGKGYHERSDLFAVGVVLYQCMVGQRPFDGRNPKEIMVETLVGNPISVRRLRPEVPEALAEFVHSLLSAEPEARPTSARSARESLGALAKEGLRWRPEPFRKRGRDAKNKDLARLHTSMVPTRQFSRL